MLGRRHESHPGQPRCREVERHRVLASCVLAQRTDQGIHQVLPVGHPRQGAANGVGLSHADLLGIQERADDRCRVGGGDTVRTSQHPVQLHQNDEADEAGPFVVQALDQPCGPQRLLVVVLDDVADQDVGIEADHRRARSAAPAATASSMSSSDTGTTGAGTIPLSAVTEAVFGAITNDPLSIGTNSTRDPALKPSLRLTSAGMVICPLLVTVAAGMGLALLIEDTPYFKVSGPGPGRKVAHPGDLPAVAFAQSGVRTTERADAVQHLTPVVSGGRSPRSRARRPRQIYTGAGRSWSAGRRSSRATARSSRGGGRARTAP